jgi:hypothetical protein
MLMQSNKTAKSAAPQQQKAAKVVKQATPRVGGKR